MRLFTMAALGAVSSGFFVDWILQELLELDDPQTLPAFLRWATGIDLDGPFQQESTACYVLSMKGYSRFLSGPPAQDEPRSDAHQAWHAYGAIIFWLYRPGLSVLDRRAAAAESWHRLRANWPLQAAVALLQLEEAGVRFREERRDTVDDLCSVFPDEVRSVLEFGLADHESLTEIMTRTVFRETAIPTLIRRLGVIGNRETAKLLERLLDAPAFGAHAVEALRSLNRRS